MTTTVILSSDLDFSFLWTDHKDCLKEWIFVKVKTGK